MRVLAYRLHTILEEGFAWNGQTFGSLSQIAKAMTGTNWNGHRTAAVDCFRLDGHTIFATVRGARDPVDRLPGADPFAGHGISPLARPGKRCPRRVRKPSRRLGQIDDGCAVGSP